MIVLASAEELKMSYNARMSCINIGIFILNSSKSLRMFFCGYVCLFVRLFCRFLGGVFFWFCGMGFYCWFVRFLFVCLFHLVDSPQISLLSQRRRWRKLMFLSHMFHY